MIFFMMLFAHVIDDYYLQGILASMKQKSWWIDLVPDLENSIYKNDYKAALSAHAFSWAISIHIPLIIFTFTHNIYENWFYIISIIINTIIHFYVDDLKANKKKINLIQDLIIHLVQIAITFSIKYYFNYIL